MADFSKTLEEYEVDELLAELRFRESRPKDLTKAKRAAGDLLKDADDFEISRVLRSKQKVIYGVDDRQEAFEIENKRIREISHSVAGLVPAGRIRDNGDGTSEILTIRFADSHRLCSSERFGNQPTAPNCSGFLVAPDIIATAGHCVDNTSLPQVRFVFGFRMKTAAQAQSQIKNRDIYAGTGIIARELISNGADYALVRLDRPVQGRPILRLHRDGKIADNAELYVMGHPSGLPLKYAPGAAVRDNDPQDFFVANLDTYGGNSGSPVFNQQDNVVAGILVRGETDFVNVGGCFVSNVCPTSGCRGEDVTRATVFAEHVPETEAPGPEEGVLEARVDVLEDRIDEIREILDEVLRKLS